MKEGTKKALLDLARDRLSDAIEGDRDNREMALDDVEFLVGRQWPEDIKRQREAQSRPVITINRLPQFVRQVTGDIRKLNPSIKVIPGDNEASQDVAEVIDGIIRQIEADSSASSVYESAAESAAQCGFGFWRVRADYEDDDTFDQCVKVERIANPFSVYCDPEAREPTRSDADFWFILEHMQKDDFEEAYPGKSSMDVERPDALSGSEHWINGERVVVAEYFYYDVEEVTIAMREDGSIVEDPQDGETFARTRTVSRKIPMWAKVSGADVLEGPKRLPGKFLPVIAVVGEEVFVGEEVVRSSVIRYAKDPQRLYNYWKSTHAEQVALQPKAPYLVTARQIKGLDDMWRKANVSNSPVLVYNPDESAPPPQRSIPPQPSAGMMSEVMQAADDMKATTGIYDAGLGAQSNEKSGVAIRQRQLEADVSTSIYTDNLAKSIEHSGRIIVSMIPEVYDTERVVMILGEEGAEKLVKINSSEVVVDQSTGEVFQRQVNPLSVGKYSVRVTVGPNYSTRRQETAESMMQFVQSFPQAGQVAGDLIAKAMDWPDADKLAERLAKVLPPGLIGPDEMTPEQQQGIQQMMAQQQAAMQAQMQAQQIEAAKQAAEAQEAQADARKAVAEAERAEIEAQEAALRLQALLAQRQGVMPAIPNGVQPPI